MNLSSFRSFKCRRIPAAILLSAIVTASPAVTYQARAEPLENVISESEPDEPLLLADESTDGLTDSVMEVPEPEQDVIEPDPTETWPLQDTSGPDPAEREPATDSSVPEVAEEKEDTPDESPSDESASDAAGKDESEPERPADESSSRGGKMRKPSKKEETKPTPDKPSEDLQSGTEPESPAPETATVPIPEATPGDSTELVITIPAISSEGTMPSEKRWKLKEKKVEEFKLADGTVWTTAETVNAQLNVRTGKGEEFDVAGRIRKGGVFFRLDARTEGGWVFIETEDAGHHVLRGYVRREYITDINAKARLKKYGDSYRSYVQVSRTEKDNPVFGDIKKTVYRHVVKEHTRVTYEWMKEENGTGKLKTMAVSADRSEIVRYAEQFLGNPYVWGGESLTDGCDCSGFTMLIYRQFGIELPRCSYEQAEAGIRINAEDALPGDLLFYERNGTIYHVLMYIGDGQAINASSSSTGIIISNVDYGKTCWGVRLIDTDTLEGDYEPDRTNYSQSDLELIWAVVAQEDDKSYEGALAVISSAMNRADKNYGGYGRTVLEQLTADGQYCYSPKVSDSSLYQRRLGGNVADYVKQAVSDCLTKGIRNHDYLNFRSSNRTGLYTRIGDNWYF